MFSAYNNDFISNVYDVPDIILMLMSNRIIMSNHKALNKTFYY